MLRERTRPFVRLGACAAGLVLGACSTAPAAKESEPQPAPDARAGLAWPASAPVVPASRVLSIYSAGLDALLPDPRDAGLRHALSMLDERIIELPEELGDDEAPPPDSLALLFDVLAAPSSLVLDVTGEGSWIPIPPLHLQLTVGAQSPAEADALTARFGKLLGPLVPWPIAPLAEHPGMQALTLPVGRLTFGRLDASPAFAVAWGEPTPGVPAPVATGLPPGIAPVFALDLDLGLLQDPLEQGLAMGSVPEAVRRELAWFGVLGDEPLHLSAALGYDKDRAHWAVRYGNWVPVARVRNALAAEPLTARELRLVPADATFASVSKVDPRALGTALDVLGQGKLAPLLAQAEAALGLELEADVLAPLGQTVGLYMSDTTGGGGVASLTAFATLRDPERLARTLDRLAQALDELARGEAEGRVRARKWTYAGSRCVSVVFPGLPIPLEPSASIVENTLILAASSQGLAAAIDQARGKSGTGLPDHPTLRALAAGDLEGLQSLTFSDTPRLLRDGYGYAGLVASMLANAVRSPADGAREPGLVLPPYHELLAGSRPSFMLTRIQGDDLVGVGECDRSFTANATAFLGGPTGLLFFAGAAAATIVPRFVQEQRVYSPPEEVEVTLQTAARAKALAEIHELANAATEYAVENGGRYPDSLEALLGPDEDGEPFLDELPLDPWGNPYGYEPPPSGAAGPRVFSLGADGVPGGEGEDADIDTSGRTRLEARTMGDGRGKDRRPLVV